MELAQPSIDLCDADMLVFVEGATHWVHHEAPNDLNELILDPISATETVYRQVDMDSVFVPPLGNIAPGMDRTLISLRAPGVDVEVGELGPTAPEVPRTGTSYAAPHVTGTVALLQQAASHAIATQQPRWPGTIGTPAQPTAHRHELMKAVLMNSADKLVDDGTVMAPGPTIGSTIDLQRGALLGMDRTTVMQFVLGQPD
jgi:hypothetical protein